MPLLLANNFSIDFGALQEDRVGDLPAYLQPIARLIISWKSGQETFHLYTSGSTGNPKQISLYRDKIIYSAKLTASTFSLTENDTLFCCLGTNYVAGFMMVMRALVLNCNLYVTPAEGNPLQNTENIQLDFAAFVPLQLDSIYTSGEKYFSVLNRMKAIIVGGAPVSDSLLDKLQQLECPVYHTYAMTETYTHVAIRRLNGTKKSEYYYPLEGIKLSVDGRNCLVVQSPITDNKPLVTNDVVDIQNDGSFLWLGRYDNIINSGGIKIQAEQIEQAAKNTMAKLNLTDAELFAYGLPDEKLGQKLVLFIEDSAWPSLEQKQFLQEMREVLSAYKAPKELIFKDHFQRTATGKVDRNNTVKSSW